MLLSLSDILLKIKVYILAFDLYEFKVIHPDHTTNMLQLFSLDVYNSLESNSTHFPVNVLHFEFVLSCKLMYFLTMC